MSFKGRGTRPGGAQQRCKRRGIAPMAKSGTGGISVQSQSRFD